MKKAGPIPPNYFDGRMIAELAEELAELQADSKTMEVKLDDQTRRLLSGNPFQV